MNTWLIARVILLYLLIDRVCNEIFIDGRAERLDEEEEESGDAEDEGEDEGKEDADIEAIMNFCPQNIINF